MQGALTLIARLLYGMAMRVKNEVRGSEGIRGHAFQFYTPDHPLILGLARDLSIFVRPLRYSSMPCSSRLMSEVGYSASRAAYRGQGAPIE